MSQPSISTRIQGENRKKQNYYDRLKTGESNDCEGVKGRGTLSTDSYTENLP